MSDLPSGWELAELGDIVDVLDSRRVPVNATERAQRPGDVPYYGATGQVGWIDEALFNEELVLLGEDGAPFLDPAKPKAYLIDGPSWVNNHAHVLRAISQATTNRFLKYVLDAADYREHVNGTTRLKLTQKAMRAMPIPLPPRAEQERIVAAIEEHLSRLDATAGHLRRLALGVGRLELAALVALLEQTEAESIRLGDLCVDTQIGLVRSRDQQGVEAGVPYVRMQDITTDGRLLVEGLTRINVSTEELGRYGLREGDLLFNTRNSVELVGKTAIVRPGVEGTVFNNNIMRIRLDDRILPDFALMQFISPPFRRRLASVTSATTSVAAIYAKNLLPLELRVPPLTEQAEVVRRFHDLRERASRTMRSIEHGARRASVLRHVVLAAAFSGELVPPDPDDEPPSQQINRSRTERATAATPTKRMRKATAS